MDKTFTYNFGVKGYELDSFGHVNNAVYLNYLEQARWEIVEKLGILELIKGQNGFLIVVEISVKYVNELKIFDKAFVKTTMHKKGFFVEFKQLIKKGDKKVAKAIVKCLFVDKNRKPCDIPDQLLPYLNE